MWNQGGFFDHWNYIEKITWKQRGFFDHWNYIEKSTWKQRGRFDHRNYVEKYVETTWIFRQSKLYRKKYVKTTWIFRPLKLHEKKYVETTWIFGSAKLHRKSTSKRRENSSKFGLWLNDVISTSNWVRFDVVCPLGSLKFSLKERLQPWPNRPNFESPLKFSNYPIF